MIPTIPRYPIVDCGVLFDFLLWRFSESIKIPALKADFRHLKTGPYKMSLRWYFGKAKPIVTCPEVLAEIHGHAQRKWRGQKLGSFWTFAQKELRELGLSEKLVKLLDMDGTTLSILGPTDTAILYLSRELNQPVLTEDHELSGKCRKEQLKVIGIADLYSLWQQHVK